MGWLDFCEKKRGYYTSCLFIQTGFGIKIYYIMILCEVLVFLTERFIAFFLVYASWLENFAFTHYIHWQRSFCPNGEGPNEKLQLDQFIYSLST
jgi:hypothetical protein